MKHIFLFFFLLTLLSGGRTLAVDGAGKDSLSPDERAKETLQHAEKIDKRSYAYAGAPLKSGEAEATQLRFQILRDPSVGNAIRMEAALILARRESTNPYGNVKNAIDAVEYALKELNLSSQERVALLTFVCDAAERAAKVTSPNPAVPSDTLEKTISRILAEPAVSDYQKVIFYEKLARNLALQNRDEEALKTIRDFADSLPEGGTKIQAMIRVASILGYLGREQDAIDMYRSLLTQTAKQPHFQAWVKSSFFPYLSSVFRFEDALKDAIEYKDPLWQAEILQKGMGKYKEARLALIAGLDDPTIPADLKKSIFKTLVCDFKYSFHQDAIQAVDRHMPEMENLFGKEFGKLFRDAGIDQWGPIDKKNYPFAVRCFELAEKNGYPPEFLTVLYHTTALAGLFRYADAAKVASEGAADSRYPVEQRYALALAAAVLNAADDSAAIKKAIDGVEKTFAEELKSLPPKKRSDAICRAAKIALIGIRNAATEELSARDALLFTPRPPKFYDVEFSRTPIHGISDFERLKSKPQVGIHDRPYGGNMDFLVTDVATGDRGTNVGTEKMKGDKKFTEGQIACDEDGLHFLFRSYDSRAKEIAAGLASAGSYELYLSAGKDQPYFCLCPDLTTGEITFIWQSSYTNRFYRRPLLSDRKGFRTESRTADDGYLTYFFISWEYYYNMLPEKDDLWYFENIHWGMDGGYTWGGARSIHGRSDSVRLRFHLGDAERSAIRRKILAAAYKKYRNERKCYDTEGVLSFWPDPETGDPEFYKNCVLPLEKKLDACADRYRADMNDQEVDNLYREVVLGWNNLEGEVTDLRRRYLEEQLIPAK